MPKSPTGGTRAILNIPRAEKLRRLSAMDESEFRDRIVRPLFFARGYKDGRDLHGTHEEGKDILFEENDKLGEMKIICVQTKKGNINLSAAPARNIETAITQLRTALNSRITRLEDRQRYYPDDVFLCASGKINTPARNHIAEEGWAISRPPTSRWVLPAGPRWSSLTATNAPTLWCRAPANDYPFAYRRVGDGFKLQDRPLTTNNGYAADVNGDGAVDFVSLPGGTDVEVLLNRQ